MDHNTHTQQKVGWGGYLAFFITIILFSGMFAKSTEWWRVFDFTVLCSAAIFFAPKRDKFCTVRGCPKDTFCTVQK